VTLRSLVFSIVLGGAVLPLQQAPQPIDTSTIGPRVGATVPPIEGIDQFGRKQTLASVGGKNGVMLVFFRSADW
jgi:hypothetical protein